MGTKRKSVGIAAVAFVVCAFMAAGAFFTAPLTRALADSVDLGGGITVNIEGRLGKVIDPAKTEYQGFEPSFELNGKTYYNLENGYLVGVRNGSAYTVERAYGNQRVKAEGAQLQKVMIDPEGAKVAEQFATGADDPSALIRIYFGGDQAKVKTALKASYRDFIANNPEFNPGIVNSLVKAWNGMLVQDFYLGDSAFNAWAADDGKSDILGRAHLCSLIYNPNLGKFVMMTDYLKLWDDRKDPDGARALGYPVTQMFAGIKKIKDESADVFREVTDLQIFEKGYMYKSGETAEFVLGKSCADLTVSDEFVFETYLKTEPHRYNEYGTIATAEVQTAQGIVDRFVTETRSGDAVEQFLYTNYLRGYTKCAYLNDNGVITLGAPVARAGVWAVRGSDAADANVTEKYVPMHYEISSFGADRVDVGMIVSVAHGIDDAASALYRSYGKTDPEELKAKFVAKYEQLRSAAAGDARKTTPGVASDIIKTWSAAAGGLAVISQDYYDGDSTGSFGGTRTNVTSLVYSSRNDAVYALRDAFLNAYGSRIATLGEPRSDAYAGVSWNGATGQAQNFRTGALFVAADGSVSTIPGKHYDGTAFADIALEDTDIVMANFSLDQLQSETTLASYVQNWTEADFTAFKAKFLDAYRRLKTDTFNPGQPTLSGITIYRTATAPNSPIVCQLYESGTVVDNGIFNDAGTRVTLALIYNFEDGNVYAVNGGVLTKAATLLRGWPAADVATGLGDGDETLFGAGAKYFEFKRGGKAVTVAYTDQGKWLARAASYADVVEAKREDLMESVLVEFDEYAIEKKMGDADFRLAVTLTPAGLDGVTLRFASDDEEVATVDAQGNVTIVGEGYCTITVWIDGYDAQSESWASKHSECDIDVLPADRPADTGTGKKGCNGALTGTALGAGVLLLTLGAALVFALRRRRG